MSLGLRSIRARNLELNAFTHLISELPTATSGPLDGALVAVKDNIMVRGMPMEAGSLLLQGHEPVENATCVQALIDAGARILGKTGMDEFGMGSHTLHSRSGPVLNPRHRGRVSPGGSSGGSAAAVAAGFCPFALGTDTGGSVRLPAAYCGVFGFKPTYGRISRHGLVSYASSLDTVGILAASLEWTRRAFDCVKDRPEGDMTAIRRRDRVLLKRPEDISIGIVDELFPANCSAKVLDAVERALLRITGMGAKTKRLRLPALRSALPVYYVTAMVEAGSCLARYGNGQFGPPAPALLPAELPFAQRLELTRCLGFGEQVLERIEMGAALASAYGRAQELRAEMRAALDSAFSQVDLLLCPTAPSGPPSLASVLEGGAGEEWDADALAVPASLAGLPALSLPLGLEQGLGLQLIGPHCRDEELLHLAPTLHKLAND